jgi:hypothetical protein
LNRIRTTLLLGALGVACSAPAGASTQTQALAAHWVAAPGAGQSLAAGASITLRFTAEQDVDEMEILLSLDGGRTFPLRVSREMPERSRELLWRVPNFPTTQARLALRTGDANGETIRDVSPEFTILASPAEPLEEVRRFGGEWRAGDACDEVSLNDPFDTAALAGAAGSVRALVPGSVFMRSADAGPTGEPPDGEPESIEPIRTDLVSPPPTLRVPRHVPRRE